MFELALDFEKVYGSIDSFEEVETKFLEIIQAGLDDLEKKAY